MSPAPTLLVRPTLDPAPRHRRRDAVLAGLLILLSIAFLAPEPADATWRCGSRLVAIGDSAGRVLARCGEPTYRNVSTELVTLRYLPYEITRIIAVETWTYDRGPNEFVRELLFRDGFLEWVAEDGYGG